MNNNASVSKIFSEFGSGWELNCLEGMKKPRNFAAEIVKVFNNKLKINPINQSKL